MKRERLSTAESLGWSLASFGAGLFGGLWAGAWIGRVTRGRLAADVRALRSPAGRTTVALAGAVQEALASDPTLSAHNLRCLAVSGRRVELLGWVPDRPSRARAFRLATNVPGLENVINSILVHGEDDLPTPPTLTLEGRSA